MRLDSRLYGIDCLRGIAILLVIISHAFITIIDKSIPGYFGNGWVGVDLFFVISGFVVSRSFLNWINSAQFNSSSLSIRLKIVTAYFIRRTIRLLPIAWLWAFMHYVFTIYYNESGYFGSIEDVGNALRAVLLFYYNYYLADTNNYRLLVYWSLALEEHFYLFFLLLSSFFLLSKNILKILTFIFTLGLFFRWVSLFNDWNTHNQFMYYSHFRFDGLILGTLVGLASKFCEQYTDKTLNFISNIKYLGSLKFLLVIALTLIPSFFNDYFMTIIGFTLLAGISTALLLLFLVDKNENNSTSMVQKFLNLVGRRSYSLYLIHFILMIVFLQTRYLMLDVIIWPTEEMIIPACVIYIMSLILITELNYRFLEMPLTNLARKIKPDLIAFTNKKDQQS